MFLRSICHQVSNQADNSIWRLFYYLADVSPTYSSSLPQGNVFNQPHITCNLPITRNNGQYDVQRQKRKTEHHVIGNTVYGKNIGNR